jgi:hypothetical protein
MGSISAAASTYQETVREAAVADAGPNPIAQAQVSHWTNAAQGAMELLAKLAPPEPNLGGNIDMRA